MKQTTRRQACALAGGVAALLLWTPIADADDPTDCDQLPPDQVQQCQQAKGAAIANRAVDEAKRGADQAQKQLQQQDAKNKPISQVGYLYLVNGVPTCFHNWDVGVPGMVAIQPVQAC